MRFTAANCIILFVSFGMTDIGILCYSSNIIACFDSDYESGGWVRRSYMKLKENFERYYKRKMSKFCTFNLLIDILRLIDSFIHLVFT